MFQKLQYILLFVVLVISIFFVVSTLTFTGRLAEGSSRYLVTIWHLILNFLQITRPKAGRCAGGSWTAGYLSSTSSRLGLSPTCGVHRPTTVDELLPFICLLPQGLIIIRDISHC